MEGQVRLRRSSDRRHTLTPRPPTVPADAHFFDVYPSTPLAADGCSSTALDCMQGVEHRAGQRQRCSTWSSFRAANGHARNAKPAVSATSSATCAHRINTSGDERAGRGSVNASLPTGDADNLLGSGGTRVTGGVAWTGRMGRFLPHASAGYTLGVGNSSDQFNTVAQCTAAAARAPATRATTCTEVTSPTPFDLKLPTEINFAGGTDMVFYRHLTIAADLFARRIADLNTFRAQPQHGSGAARGRPARPGTAAAAEEHRRHAHRRRRRRAGRAHRSHRAQSQHADPDGRQGRRRSGRARMSFGAGLGEH